jgi:hypothetical protein
MPRSLIGAHVSIDLTGGNYLNSPANSDITDEQTSALRKLLADAIENDRYPLFPRIRTLRGIVAKFGPMVPATAAD